MIRCPTLATNGHDQGRPPHVFFAPPRGAWVWLGRSGADSVIQEAPPSDVCHPGRGVSLGVTRQSSHSLHLTSGSPDRSLNGLWQNSPGTSRSCSPFPGVAGTLHEPPEPGLPPPQPPSTARPGRAALLRQKPVCRAALPGGHLCGDGSQLAGLECRRAVPPRPSHGHRSPQPRDCGAASAELWRGAGRGEPGVPRPGGCDRLDLLATATFSSGFSGLVHLSGPTTGSSRKACPVRPLGL